MPSKFYALKKHFIRIFLDFLLSHIPFHSTTREKQYASYLDTKAIALQGRNGYMKTKTHEKGEISFQIFPRYTYFTPIII